MTMVLPSATPREWIETYHRASLLGSAEPPGGGRRCRNLTRDEVLAQDGALLGELHAALVRGGTPPKAAAKYLAHGFGALLARAVGYAVVASGASFVVDAGVCWRIEPDDLYPGTVDLGMPLALVDPTHRWAGLPGTEVVADEGERFARANAAVVTVVAPIIDVLRVLSGLGRAGLWAEVADGYAGWITDQQLIEVTERRIDLLRGLVDADGAPWKTGPQLWTVHTEHGVACCMQKGGCCLHYTEPQHASRGGEGVEDDDHDPLLAEFREAFAEPGAPAYCTCCSLRARTSVQERQLWWFERRRPPGIDDASR
ncbi:MAG: hypothetical protein QM679_03345 [Patulibacter sp.]